VVDRDKLNIIFVGEDSRHATANSAEAVKTNADFRHFLLL
jgi:hypothetical protein